MSEQWLYQVNGRDAGPVSFAELQELAANSLLSTDSEVRSLSSFSWQRASHVEGLTFASSEMASSQTLKSDSDSDMTTKAVDEWYCNVGGLELGPLTFDELLDLAKTQQISADDEVRLGAGSKWRRAGSVGRLMAAMPYQSPDLPKAAAPLKRKTSKSLPRREEIDPETAEAAALIDSFLFEPDRMEAAPVAVPSTEPSSAVDSQAAFQLAYQQASEAIAASILFQAEATFKAAEASAKAEVAWASGANIDKQWWGWMGNVEFGPIEFPQVFALAQNGQLKPTDFIRNGAFGQFVPSSTLPGLFNAVAMIAKASETLALAQSQAKAAVDAADAVPPLPQAVEIPTSPAVTPSPNIIVPPLEFDATDFGPAEESPVAATRSRIRPRRNAPGSAIGIPLESDVIRSSSRSKGSSEPVADREPKGEDEARRRVEECLETLNIPGNPRIAYSLEIGVVTVRGSLASEGERLLVLRRVGAVPGVVRVDDEMTVVQAARPVAAAVATLPPVRLKKTPARSDSPGLVGKLKDAITDDYGAHLIGLALAVAFLGYWYFPRSPVRPLAVHPVKGRVVIDGEPLANAIIALHHVGRGKSKFPAHLHPHGKAVQDGTFALETFDPADGAPEGEFVATVFLVEEKVDADGDKSYGPNLLPPIYGKPETSPFKVKITSSTKELEPLKLTRR